MSLNITQKIGHKFQIGERVSLEGRTSVRIVVAIYPIETWYYYKLSQNERVLLREDLLTSQEVT